MTRPTTDGERWFKFHDDDGDIIITETLARWTHRGTKLLTGLALTGGALLAIDSAMDIVQNNPDIAKDAAGIAIGAIAALGSGILLSRLQSEEEFIGGLEEV